MFVENVTLDKQLRLCRNCEEMPPTTAGNRRQALRDYLLEIARDLVSHGQVHVQRGQPLEDVIRTAPGAVLAVVSEDLAIVGRELGAGFALGLGGMLQQRLPGPAGEVVAGLGRAFASWLSTPSKKP